MAKQNKVLPYIIFGVPALIAVYLIYKSIAGKKKGQDAPDEVKTNQEGGQAEESPSGGGVRPAITKYFPLKKGSKGAKVKELQEAILSYDKTLLPKFGADSDFGSETEAAVVRLLNKNSVDSQQEIDDIRARKAKEVQTAAEKQKIQVANANRVSLANKLVAFFKENPSVRNFFALSTTRIGKYKVTSDGREIQEATPTFNAGQKLYLSRITRFQIGSTGFISAYDGSNMYYFSPYAFEVK